MTDDPRVLRRQATIAEQLEKTEVPKILYVRCFRVSLSFIDSPTSDLHVTESWSVSPREKIATCI